MQKLRYAAYIRVSDERQLNGFGLAAQQTVIEKFIERENGLLVESYIDGGISATTTEGRDEFHRMRSDARRGLFDVLVVHKFDRLARNRLDAMTTKIMLRKDCGIKILSATGEPSVDNDPIMGGLIEGIMEAMHEWYSVNLGQEVRKGRVEMLEQKKWYGTAPYGYRRDENEGILVPDTVEAPILQEIFNRYASGSVGMRRLAQELNDKGFRTRQFAKKGGQEWGKGTLQKMLKSRVYIGELPYQPITRNSANKRTWDNPREWIQGTHEALISLETFKQCQANMKANEHNVVQGAVGGRYMLDGLCFCADCQMINDMDNPAGRMFGRARKHISGNENLYYYCKHTPKAHGHARADYIEAQLIEFLLSGALVEDFDGKEKTISAIAADYDMIEVENRITELATKIDKLDFRWDNGAITNPERFLTDRQKLEDEIAVLKPRISESYETALSVVNNFPAHWEATNGNFEAQRTLIRTIVHQVIIADKQIAGIIIKPSHEIVFTHRIISDSGGDCGGEGCGLVDTHVRLCRPQR